MESLIKFFFDNIQTSARLNNDRTVQKPNQLSVRLTHEKIRCQMWSNPWTVLATFAIPCGCVCYDAIGHPCYRIYIGTSPSTVHTLGQLLVRRRPHAVVRLIPGPTPDTVPSYRLGTAPAPYILDSPCYHRG